MRKLENIQTAEQMREISKENAEKELLNKIHETASNGKLEIEVDEKEWFGFLNELENDLKSHGYVIDYIENADGDTTVIISWR